MINKKISLFVIVFSGIAALITGGLKALSIYSVNIALIYLSCIYVSSKKKNEELTGLIQK